MCSRVERPARIELHFLRAEKVFYLLNFERRLNFHSNDMGQVPARKGPGKRRSIDRPRAMYVPKPARVLHRHLLPGVRRLSLREDDIRKQLTSFASAK